MQGGGVRDVVPRDTKDGVDACDVKCVETVFLAAVFAPRLAEGVEEHSGHTRSRSMFDSEVVIVSNPRSE